MATRFDYAEVKRAASGRWAELLVASGLAPEVLNGRHHPCPGCGGADRFRFIDREQDGFFICNGAGDRTAGDGFRLLEHVHGMTPGDALRFVADYLGLSGREISQADRNAYRNRRILEALAHELEVLRLAVSDRLAGREHKQEDTDRECLAAERVRNGLRMLYGR